MYDDAMRQNQTQQQYNDDTHKKMQKGKKRNREMGSILPFFSSSFLFCCVYIFFFFHSKTSHSYHKICSLTVGLRRLWIHTRENEIKNQISIFWIDFSIFIILFTSSDSSSPLKKIFECKIYRYMKEEKIFIQKKKYLLFWLFFLKHDIYYIMIFFSIFIFSPHQTDTNHHKF